MQLLRFLYQCLLAHYVFCNSQPGYKKMSSQIANDKYTKHMLMPPQKILHHNLNHSTCYIHAFLNHCIHTLQHIHQDCSFYIVYVQGQPLALPLCCNTCHMLTMKISSFHVFNLPCIFLPSLFICSVACFSKHPVTSETPNSIV